MLSYVSEGNLKELEQLFSNLSVGQAGVMADNYLRQLKNTFITTATLVSRAAIQGGLSTEDSLSLSDSYIQHCEKFTSPEQLIHLQYHMVLDFTSRVADINCNASDHLIIRTVTAYVNEHITENLSVKQIAEGNSQRIP